MDNSDTRVVLHLTFRVAKDTRGRIIDFVRSAAKFYERPGGIRVRLLQSTQEPEVFIEVIEYDNWSKYCEDAARLESDETMKSYIEEWRSLLLAPAKIEVFTEPALGKN